MTTRLAGTIIVALGLVLALAVTAVPATAQDALICRKRDKQGDKSGGLTKLKGKKGVNYNAGEGNDELHGTPGDDIINGGPGNDKVYGEGGNDIVCGGTGKDKVFGDGGNDEVYGEEDNDYLEGGPGNDYMIGQAGRDRLIGYGMAKGQPVADGDDFIEGTYEPDVIVVGGFDIAYGGGEPDDISSRTPGIGAQRLDGGPDTDKIYGSEGGDDRLLYGDIGNDTIRGLGGNDTIRGGDNDDTLFGDAGNDLVYGESGHDSLSGGPDTDLCDAGDRPIDTTDGTCERKVGFR
jgi:Ca2+-binding RTX toxin-like protein